MTLPRAVAFGLLLAAPVANASDVELRVVVASQRGVDDAELVELAGDPGAPLGGLSLIVVEGDAHVAPGRIDRRLDFRSEESLGSRGTFLVGNCTGVARAFGVRPDRALGTDFFENSSFTLALVETRSLAEARVTGRERVRDAVALADADPDDVFFFDAPQVGPDGAFFAAGAERNGSGSWGLVDFERGADRAPEPAGGDGCLPRSRAIFEIQGRGGRSPFDQEPVRTSGIVTHATTGGRVWLQDPEGDSDAQTSDAVEVVGRAELAHLRPGDRIRLRADVEEAQTGNDRPRTRLVNPSEVEILARAQRLPDAVALRRLPDRDPTRVIAFWSTLEAMRVGVAGATVVGPTLRGELALVARGNARAGSGFVPRSGVLRVRGFGSGRVDYNPERIGVSGVSSAFPPLRVGDRVDRLAGVVEYASGAYRVRATELVARARALSPSRTRRLSPRETRVVSWNVENLFDLEDAPGKADGSSTPSPVRLDVKLAKLERAIVGRLQLPDLLVVQEVENERVLGELARRVNREAGTRYVATSFESSDVRGIEVGFLWDRQRIALLDAFPLGGPAVEAAFGPGSPSPGREPLVGRFRVGRSELVVIGNHFVSKRRDDPVFGVEQPPRRASERLRVAQARAVRSFVDELHARDRHPLVLVTGDLNDFPFAEPGEGREHPLALLRGRPGARLFDLVRFERPSERFTFNFRGNAQQLDHALASRALRDRIVGVDVLHFNASYPEALASEPGHPFRASDHDPIELRFDLDGETSPGRSRHRRSP